jgi:pectinesterase
MVVSNHEAGGRLVLVVVGLMLMTSAATTTDGDAAAAAAAAAGGAPLRLSAGSTTNAQVAQDGRPGSYPTISQALEHAPTHEYEHVVFIGKGTYPETLTITRPNVRLVGEGIGRTIITGNRCKRTGYDTASSATVSK